MAMFQGEFWELVDGIIDDICVDESYDIQEINEVVMVGSQTQTWEDEMEFAGPTFASVKPEDTAIEEVDIARGYKNRRYLVTFALKMAFSEELEEEGPSGAFSKVTDATRWLRQSMGRTHNYEGMDFFRKAWDTTETVIAASLPLCSASHTLPRGGTYSNTLSPPLTPSANALEVMSTLARQMPDRQGLRGDFKLWKIVHPVDQDHIWEKVLGAEKDPVLGNFVIPSAVKKLGISHMGLVDWDNTGTNWGALTSVQKDYGKKGLFIGWKYKTRTNKWVDNDTGRVMYSAKMRRSRSVFDPRCFFGSQA